MADFNKTHRYSEIHWFPGHMAKTRRIIKECLPSVDAVIEILDARIPLSSRNPEINEICSGKPRLVILSKSSLANPSMTAAWKKYFENKGGCIAADFINGNGLSEIEPAIRALLSEKSAKNEARGMGGKELKAMVVGIPNVGKSSFINKFSGSKKAKVEDKPGVTREKQWVKTPYGIDLLDMPGVLWPKLSERRAAENLAITGAVKDSVLNTEELAVVLCKRLLKASPELFFERYKIKPEEIEDLEDYEIFELVGRKRGFLISGGEINYERTALTLLDEYRSGKIGRITLELPPREVRGE